MSRCGDKGIVHRIQGKLNMKFMRSMIYLFIAVMFGLVIVILTYDVRQCDQTVQTRMPSIYKSEALKWFKWARVFSFCRYINLAYDYGCKTHDCKECLTVCLMDNKIRNVLSLCKNNCTTNACKEGCHFYSEIFIYLFDRDHTTIKKPRVIGDGYERIKVSAVINAFDLSWPSVFSSDAVKIPSLYLVAMYGSNIIFTDEYILTLTETSRHLVQRKDICRDYPREADLTFHFYVMPINFVGPSSTDLSNDFYGSFKSLERLRSVDNVLVSKPFFEKSVKDNFNHIMWEIEWKKMPNVTFQVRYNIYTCSVYTNMIEMRKLNPEKIYFVKKESFRMRVRNSDDDKLHTCSIYLELRTRQGQCFRKPYTAIIKYGGCETIPGYPHPCQKNTLIYEFSIKISAVNCVNPSICECPQSKNNKCQCCPTTTHRIKVTWKHPTYVMNMTEYTVRWGDLTKGVFIDPKTAKLPKNYTSYTIDFSANKTKSIGIQVHAETPMSKPRLEWQSNVNSIQTLTLKPLEPKLVSPSFEARSLSPTLASKKDEILSPTIFIEPETVSPAAVLFAMAIFFLIFFIIYRRWSILKKIERKKVKIKEKQKRDAVDKWEISYAILNIGKKIGEGAFGNVFCAFVKTIELRKTPYAEQCSGITLKKKKVAVKFLKDDALEKEYKDFCKEIKLMKEIGFHQNIVNMIGCGTIIEPPFLVLEYMNGGDLLNYMRVLRKNKSYTGLPLRKAAVAATSDDSTENADHLSPHDVMSFSWQIASGMEYLSMKNVVHRDLAARNILITDDKKIKISDFGLSRFLGDEWIYLSRNKSRKLPIKWMSIEAIYNQKFTTASDVWAYGVVLFEMVTLGGTPYPLIGNHELCKILKSGYRMDKPDNCDDTVYHIMLQCWNEIPTQRPTFTELRERLEELVERDETYFSFDIDENNSYYNVASFKSIPSDVNDDGDDAIAKESVELLNH